MKTVFTFLAALMSACCLAQTPTLFANLSPATGQRYGVANLAFGTIYNNKLLFQISDSSTQTYTVYATDGTVTGTTALKTISQVANFWEYNNALYFGFKDATAGEQLWKTDGTVSGTVLVKTFGGNAIAPNTFAAVGGKMVFVVGDSSNPFIRKMYVSDGTTAGTHPLKPGLYECDYYYGSLNGKLLFSASANVDSVNQKELYITDGTAAGTALLKDINPGTTGSRPKGFRSFNNQVYFVATTTANGAELWKTDGTTAGTVMVIDLNPAGDGCAYMDVYNNRLYFTGNNGSTGWELFTSDGTAAGTQLLMDIKPGAQGSYPSGIIVMGNKLVFSADDGTHGQELWKTDGTAAGTSLLKDVNPGTASGAYGIRAQNRICDNRFYFDGSDDQFNVEPWVTDGTAAGTVKLGEINPGVGGSLDGETFYLKLGNRVYFVAYSPATGRELYYVTDTCTTTAVTPAIAQSSEVALYPNPAQGTVKIALPDALNGATIRFCNVTGAVVKTAQATENEMHMDISALPAGFYTVMVESKTERVVRKLVVR